MSVVFLYKFLIYKYKSQKSQKKPPKMCKNAVFSSSGLNYQVLKYSKIAFIKC